MQISFSKFCDKKYFSYCHSPGLKQSALHNFWIHNCLKPNEVVTVRIFPYKEFKNPIGVLQSVFFS